MNTGTCEDGCNGCDECTDYYCGDEYGDEPHGPPEFGCCLPEGECCMPGLHFPSECHTSAMYELAHQDYPCRGDGRCQYAIDHGAEGMGHCPAGKCVMPPGETP